MSLKDRLKNQTKTAVKIENKEQQSAKVVQNASEIPQGMDSLGELDTLFADDEINSISVLGAKNIFIERKGKRAKVAISYRDNVRLENVIRQNAKFHGIKIDDQSPYIEFPYRLGISVCATLPPLSSVATMMIKCYKDKFASLKYMLENRILSKEIALFIEALASLKLNIIIAGRKNTLKTTLLSAIAKKVHPTNSCVVFDYANELKFESSNITTYNFKNYENKNLIESIFYTNPEKILINDCPDLSYFGKFIENGYRGICATYCANSPYDVLSEIYLKKADVVIFVDKKETKRVISSISTVNGSELEDIFTLNNNFEHNSSGIVPSFYENIEQGAFSLSTAIFEVNYKHTYQKVIGDDALANALKKNINPEILRKFKKDIDIYSGNQPPKKHTIVENVQNNMNNQQNE